MTQYARPNTDISKTGWTGVSDNTDLYANVDESSASDADYNWSTVNAIRTIELKLSGVTDPVSSASHVIKYRNACSDSSGAIPGSGDSGETLDVAVSLYQGATLIATQTTNVPDDLATTTWTLTAGEANSITDYTDLRLRFVTTASGGSGSSRRGMALTWCELAVPDASTEQYATKSGNWNDTTVWSTGAVPTTGPVYANGYTVTVNVNAGCTSVNTIAGTVAAAGGGFTLANGVTLTANAIAGSTTCVTFSGTGDQSASIVGNPVGSSTTANGAGAVNSGAGTLNITGNPQGGSQTNSYGANNTSSGTLNITGNPTGGSISTAYGSRGSSSGTVNITGDPTGGSTAGAAGLYMIGTGGGTVTGSAVGSTGYGVRYAASGTLTITDNATGGDSGGGAGVLNEGTGTVTIGGNATGGTNVLAYGASNTSTGTLTVAGKAISATAPGVNGEASATLTSVGTAETGTACIAPLHGKVVFASLTAATYGIRNSSATLGTLTAGGGKTPAGLKQQVIG